MNFLFTYLHFLSFVGLVALLASEFFLLRQKISGATLSLLKKIDAGYGIAAVLVLATGIVRVYLEKGPEYYVGSHVFWTKIALFVVMAVVSIYPTVCFIKADSGDEISARQYGRIKRAVLAQMLLVPAVLFLAIWMARGIG